MLHIISTRRAFHTTMQKARKLLAVIQNHTRIQRIIVLLLLPEWSRLLCTHSLLGFSPSSLPAGSRTDQGRHDSSQHSSLFFIYGKCSQALCLFVQRSSQSHHQTGLTINAHTADYISDGCLGGKHLNDSTNRHSTVCDTAACLAKSVTRRQM